MKTELQINKELPEGTEIFIESELEYNGKYKQCPYCGQSKIPFKRGVCICGRQVGDIQYVDNAQLFSENWYEYIGKPKVEKLGIAELMDN